MKQPKVSIIVPVYNVEKYLDRCMQSLLGQTLKELEIILVDDGSPDNIWGIERSGFFNGREKWVKGFENQMV